MIAAAVLLALGLLFLGSPLVTAFSIGSLLGLFGYLHMPLQTVGLQFFESMNKFGLLAVPFFIFAGNLMGESGIARSLSGMGNAMVGGVRGGMGCALTISCAFFGALTGSNVSTAVTMGTVMVPPLVQAGYGKRFCAGLTCASSSLGEFIPPSIAAIIYGTVVQVSVAKVFMASLLPGIILIGLLAIPTLLIARARNYGATIKMTWPERGRILLKGAPAMVIPFIILGGIYLGVFTPTEAAAVACLASFLIGYLVYRGLTLDKVVQTLKRSIVTTANTFFVIAACTMLGAVLTYAQVPQNLMNTMLAWGITSMSFMLMAVVILFIMGMFMTPGAMILVSMPVFLPLMHQLGINVYVFYVIIVGMVGIAAVTPPVAIILFVTSDLVQEQPLPVFLETIPWLAMIVVAILLTIFFPALATYIPSRM